MVPNDKKLETICGTKKTELLFKGPNLLLEFNAGFQVPPFDYNGFAANLEFIEGPPTTTSAAPILSHANNTTNHHRHGLSSSTGIGLPPPAITDFEWTSKFSPCDKVFIEANGRSGHFDTRGRPFAANCRLIFKGKPTDVVHISLFNYRLKAQSCRSVIDIIDGAIELTPGGGGTTHKKSLHKMCSPIVRHARALDGNFLPPQTFISSGSQIMIALRRFHGSASQSTIAMGGNSGGPHDHNDEFIDGAYMFHDGNIRICTYYIITVCLAIYFSSDNQT